MPRFEGSFAASPGQVSIARHAVAAMLTSCPRRDEIVLVVSELAANSVLHSRSRHGGKFAVRVEVHDGDYILIQVRDAGGPWHIRTPDQERHHGLQLVGALSSEWGIDETAQTGRVVWAKVEF